MWPTTPDCREIVDTKGALLGERTAALLRGELEGLGPPDLCCVSKVPLDRKLPRLFVGADDPQEGAEVSFCHFVVGIDVSQPAPIAAYLCHLLSAQEQPTGWFRRGWRVVRCIYCTYNALYQQDLRVELSCQGAAPRRVEVRLLEASGQELEGSSISPSAWGGAALSGLMRRELPPEVPCLRVVRGLLTAQWGAGGCEGSRAFVELFEKHAGEGDLLGLLPSTGRGTNALCEVLAGHLLQSAALLPCVETLASLQGGSPLMALHISRAYARRGQLESALSVLLRCLHAYPEEACLLRQLAELLLRGGLHELAVKAAAYAVELCPTVHRYWLTLARAEIACGSWGDALLALNAAPDVSVSFPFYPHGLPKDIESYPVTQPRQRGVGYYCDLWLNPVRPMLTPFCHKGSHQPADTTRTGAAPAARAGTGLRSPKNEDIRRTSSFFQGLAQLSSSSGSPSIASRYGSLPRDMDAARGSFNPTPLAGPDGFGNSTAGANDGDAGGQRRCGIGQFHHRGFGGSFGLARGLDEEAVVRAHTEIVQREKKPRGLPLHTDMEALWRRCSSSNTAEHLRTMTSSRAQRLDLSERRRYSVLASLYKRAGLRGINALRSLLFLPSPDLAGAPPPTAVLAPFPTDCMGLSAAEASSTKLESSPVTTQEGGAPGAFSRSGCSSLTAVETVAEEATEAAIQNDNAPSCMTAKAKALASPDSSCREPSSPVYTDPNTEGPLQVASWLSGPPASSRSSSTDSRELGKLKGPVGVDVPTGPPVVRSPLHRTRLGSGSFAGEEAVEKPSEDGAFVESAKDDDPAGGGHEQQPGVKDTAELLAAGMDPVQDGLHSPMADLSLEPSATSGLCGGPAPRHLTLSFASLLADLEEDVSLLRLTATKLSWLDLSSRHLAGSGFPDCSWDAEASEPPSELGVYWLYRGALCERLHEWVEMEAAYRIAITQGVSPLALRGLLRFYVRLGLAFEALRVAHVAAQQLSALCGQVDLPFLPAWLITQLTRLVQSEGIEVVLGAEASVPHAEQHPTVQQLIEAQRIQLQAES